eukprot:2626921-Prymnesium_polylepis.3
MPAACIRIVHEAMVGCQASPTDVSVGPSVVTDTLEPDVTFDQEKSCRRGRSPLVAVAVAGSLRTFVEERIYRNLYETLVHPIRQHSNVFLALDSLDHWSTYTAAFNPLRTSAAQSVKSPPEVDSWPNHTLPPQLVELLHPVAVEWGH